MKEKPGETYLCGQPRPFCSRTGEQFVAADWRRTRRYQLEQTLEHLIVQANGDEVVIFTDLLGGSINNSAVSVLMRHRNVFVVAGINLTLLLEFLLCEEATTEAAIIYATSAARESIVFINPLITQPSSDPQGESHD